MSTKVKAFLVTIGVIVALALGMFIYVNLKIDNLIKDEIRSELGPDYSFDYNKSTIDFFGKQFALKKFSLTRRGKENDEWAIHIEEIRLYNFHPLSALRDKSVSLDSILLQNPVIKILDISRSNLSETDSTQELGATEGVLHMDFEALIIKGASLEYDPSGPEILTAGIDVDTRNLEFSSLNQETHILWKKTALSLHNISYTFPDSVFHVRIDEMEYVEGMRGISIEGLRLKPNITGEAYAKRNGNNKPIYDISIPEIIVSQPPNYTDSLFIIEKLEVISPDIYLYKNFSYPFPERHTELPQVLLQEFPYDLRVDTIEIDNASLNFEMVHDNGKTSFLTLDKGNIVLNDFQNLYPDEPAFTGNIKARFLEETYANIYVSYLYSDISPYSMTGEVSGADFDFINPFLENSAGISLSKGEFDKLKFSFYGNDRILKGYVDFYYSDLALHIKDQESEQDRKIINALSDIAGGLLFWKHNPSKNRFRRADVEVERDYQKVFLSPFFDGLMEGLLKTVSKIDLEKREQTEESKAKQKAEKHELKEAEKRKKEDEKARKKKEKEEKKKRKKEKKKSR